MLTESSVGPDVPVARVSVVSAPCGAVGKWRSSRPKCDLTSQLCIVAERRFAKKVLQQRLSTSGAFKYVSEPPEKRAARDVASAAVEIDFTDICPLGPRQRRWPVSPLGPSRRPPVTERSGAPGPAPSSAGHEVPAMVAVGTRPRRQYDSRRDESGVPLARRELGLAPGRLAARGVLPRVVHAVPNYARLPRSSDHAASVQLLQDLREPF